MTDVVNFKIMFRLIHNLNLTKLVNTVKVLVADSAVHEFTHHLHLHFVIEAVIVATHNHLADHLLGRLLAPHSHGTILMNTLGRATLLLPDTGPVNNPIPDMIYLRRDGSASTKKYHGNIQTTNLGHWPPKYV